MIPGFIELPLHNPAFNASYRVPSGQTPTLAQHNPHGQGTALVAVATISRVLPIWEGDGDVWSHSRVVFVDGGWIDVDASFEQIEELFESRQTRA